MTDTELIAQQARVIAEQRERIDAFVEMTKQIRSQLYSIGAPLNDNLLQYTSPQLRPFAEIGDLTDGMILREEFD